MLSKTTGSVELRVTDFAAEVLWVKVCMLVVVLITIEEISVYVATVSATRDRFMAWCHLAS
jgi:hypothetical protein